MSQYFPPNNPYYPPQQNPEEDFYYEEYEIEEEATNGNASLLQQLLIFFLGGCLGFVCAGFCGLSVGVLWWLDPGGGLMSTPIPGSDIGLSYEEAAYPDESVVNEQGVQLTILDVNRPVELPTIPPVEGRETVVVTIELVNLGEEEIAFKERDFMLLSPFEEGAYLPTPDAVEGALGRGELAPGEGLEGRLVFEILADEVDLVLTWEPGNEAEPRYIYLE